MPPAEVFLAQKKRVHVAFFWAKNTHGAICE